MLKEKMIKDLEAIGVETADMRPWKIWAHHMVQMNLPHQSVGWKGFRA